MFMQNLKNSVRNKRGSSLPMVLAIGLVLVIWVMSLSPIVATQGKASIDVQNQEEDYLQARSAIEFTKGELVNMVDGGLPRTFAVLKGEDDAHPDDYSPIIYKDDMVTYTQYVNFDGVNHDNDTPKDDKVAAICSVKDTGGSVYKITVTTYCDGKENISFNTTYTAPYGPGTIYPEAYKKTQALPISDFVLVDGKLGSTVLWDSPLTNGSGNTYTSYLTGKADTFQYTSTFKELLSEPNADNKFPDAGTYPAVFKFTAGVPTRTYADSERADTLVTGAKPATPTVTIESTTISGSTLTVTLKQQPSPNTNYALYCCRNKDGDVVAPWQSSRVFTLPSVSEGNQFFFYCYIMEHVSGNSMIPASDVSDAAPVALFKLDHYNRASSLSSGKQYLMYCDYSNGQYKLIKGNGSSLTTQEGSDDTLYVYGDASVAWSVTPNGSTYQYKLNGKILNFAIHDWVYGSYSLGESNSYFTTNANANNSFVIENKLGITTYRFNPGEDDFCSSSGRSIYFYPIDASISTPTGKPEPLTITIPVSSLTLDEGTTLTTIRNHYLSQCASRGVSDPKIYVVKTVNANEYAVYVSGTYNGMSIFVWLDDLTLIKALSLGYGIQGESLYFMGTNVAFDTATKDADNNTIYEPINVVADLLVIRADTIAENGPVIVSPYSPTKSKTLVFFVNGTEDGLFADHEFYLIESGTDLCSVTADDFGAKVQHVCDAPVKCEDPDCDEGTEKELGAFIFSREALTLSRNTYPAINLDIAYASDEQLAHIVSGEAIGWTSGGTWRSSTNDEKTDNALYVVCPYVNNVSGSINCSANRIMLAAAPNAEGNRQLTVPANMTLYARYISFTADEIVQDGSSDTELTVKTLLDNSDFWSMLSAWLRTDVDYNSKTLQVEYEQQTTFTLYGASFGEDVPALICRYPSPTDLFEAYDTGAQEDLTVLYQTSDLNDAFDDALNIKTVERYIEITGSETLKVPVKWAIVYISCDLNLYANYISFDSSVSKILLAKGYYGSATGDLFINTQESGYTEKEYLSFFKTTSADNYNGTILNVKNPAGLTVINGTSESSTDRYTLPKGFYIVWAENSGTSIYEIAKDVATNPDSNFIIKTEDLRKYAESIEDNTAYVDAGLEDTGGVAGGFGGGSVN